MYTYFLFNKDLLAGCISLVKFDGSAYLRNEKAKVEVRCTFRKFKILKSIFELLAIVML